MPSAQDSKAKVFASFCHRLEGKVERSAGSTAIATGKYDLSVCKLEKLTKVGIEYSEQKNKGFILTDWEHAKGARTKNFEIVTNDAKDVSISTDVPANLDWAYFRTFLTSGIPKTTINKISGKCKVIEFMQHYGKPYEGMYSIECKKE